MGAYYQDLDRTGGFDYALHRIPELGERLYRGPPVDTRKPYLACVGAAQTFGRFVTAPFPKLLSERLGIQVLNLGVGGAGPRHFNTPQYLSLLNGAEAVIIQVLSARSASNSLFDNTASGTLRGRSPFSPEFIRAEEFFARAAEAYDLATLERLAREMREDYTQQFIDLIQQISAPRILLWLSSREPAYRDDYSRPPHGFLGAFPHLVNARVINEVAAFCDSYLEIVSTAGMPQTLWPAEHSIDGAVAAAGVLENRYYPSPQMHVATASALEERCRLFVAPEPPAPAANVRFVIVAAARTGTNLLVGLLNAHQSCLCGSELFNRTRIADDVIPWPGVRDADLPRLLERRRTDPIGFWDELSASALSQGERVVGFKLLYSQGHQQEALLQHLAADRSLRVIHLTRRNLLRRLVSERQAYATSQWAIGRGASFEPRPAVEITIKEMMASIATVTSDQTTFEATFDDHPVLRLIYEDLAEHPQRVAARAAAFLGLEPLAGSPSIPWEKTGAEDLSDALIDFEGLRAKARRWAGFFDP